jgi:hypothetical protein
MQRLDDCFLQFNVAELPLRRHLDDATSRRRRHRYAVIGVVSPGAHQVPPLG